MRQAEDTRTVEMPGLDVAGQQNRQIAPPALNFPGRGRKPGQRCGAYKGALKIGHADMHARVKTGKSQAEFAALCGISERTLRTWELSGDVSTATTVKIMAQLHRLGVFGKPVAYRCAQTGSTWSGRGQMPIWMKVAIRNGRHPSDFAT